MTRDQGGQGQPGAQSDLSKQADQDPSQKAEPRGVWRFAVPAGTGLIGLVSGYIAGRLFAVPGSTQFWDIAAQPVATTLAGAGAITAGYLAFHNGEKSRALDTQHHRETTEGTRESGLRERYTTAAGQLANTSPAIREAGTYALAALADDWMRFGEGTNQTDLAYSETQVCVNLLASYLRANRQMIPVGPGEPAFEPEEFSVRHSIVTTLGERAQQWRDQAAAWQESGRMKTSIRPLRVNLEGANLAKMNLFGINLAKANLDRTDMSGANLNGANLADTRLHGAKLNWQAKLIRTDLTNAILTGADLTGADLRQTNITGAIMHRANLSGANLHRVTWNPDSRRLALASVIRDSETIWPEGFTPPLPRKDENQLELF